MSGPEQDIGENLAGDEIRKRAVSGAAIVGARGVAINVLAVLGNVALARLLVPEDYGTIALGIAVLTLAALLTDGGLGASLVRRPEPATRDDLSALLAVQLGASAVVTGIAIVLAVFLGDTAAVVAVMLAGLPLMALRGPGIVALERALDFRPLAAVDIGEVFAYYAWGIAAVAAGFGVYGLATASIVKAVVGTGILLRGAPVGLVSPRSSLEHIRPMLRFGLRFQGVQVVTSIREQGLSIGTAAVAGAATLGLWTIAYRLLQVPFLLFQALWHVSFPAMAQLAATGEDPRPIIERVTGLAAVATGMILTALAASAPALIPSVFGADYGEAQEAIPPVCIALQISGPVSVAVAGYLFAAGRAGLVLAATSLQVAVAFGLAFMLLPSVGVAAVGIGYGAAALVEAAIFAHAVRRATGARLAGGIAPAFCAALVASVAGRLLAEELGVTVLSAIAAGGAGVALYLLVIVALRRTVVVDVLQLARNGIAGARA